MERFCRNGCHYSFVPFARICGQADSGRSSGTDEKGELLLTPRILNHSSITCARLMRVCKRPLRVCPYHPKPTHVLMISESQTAMNVLRMVKLFGWEAKMNTRIEEKRATEIKWIRKQQILNLINNNLK